MLEGGYVPRRLGPMTGEYGPIAPPSDLDPGRRRPGIWAHAPATSVPPRPGPTDSRLARGLWYESGMTDPVGGEGWEARRRALRDAVARHVLRYDSYFLPFFIERAEGAYLFDDSGRRLLDFTSGQMCATLGHNHPAVVAALERGSREVMHLFSRMLAPPLTVSEAEIDEGLTILDQAIRESLDGAA